MRWPFFLARVAFICNLFFAATVVLQWKLLISNQVVLSTIVIAGFFLAPFIFNPATNLVNLALLFQKKMRPGLVPNWLAVVNFIFLLVQLFFVLFFLHDSFLS
ncbi:MAG TPA: hypothetical protein VM010_06775 [Chitinophagaceae bacterium]|nr:hypothetical protein [Chitinophagaceae bacterium]